MTIREVEELLTDLFNKAIRRHTSRKVARWLQVKEPTVWQMSVGNRANPLTQVLVLLSELKHRDKELYGEILEQLFKGLEEVEMIRFMKVHELVGKLTEYYLNDKRFDESEKRELRSLFEELIGGSKHG